MYGSEHRGHRDCICTLPALFFKHRRADILGHWRLRDAPALPLVYETGPMR